MSPIRAACVVMEQPPFLENGHRLDALQNVDISRNSLRNQI
jgi:hypothetical protein